MSFSLEKIEINKNVLYRQASGTFFHYLDMIFKLQKLELMGVEPRTYLL